MEGVPRLPMLSFRLKTSPEPANFAPSLKAQIREKFQEDPNGFLNEFRELETLRATACHPPKDFSGCLVLKKYYSQLHLLQSRFTFEDMGQLDVLFTWNDLYNGMVYSTTELKHEMACVLYNVGALHIQLGMEENRQTAEGMKNSCTHYQCAVWAFQTLNEQLSQPKETDLCPDIVCFMAQVSLAQAQECILEKSMVDGRKAGIVAKVAAQIVDYYKQALKTLDKDAKSAEGNPVEEVVGSKLYKRWHRYVEFKMNYHRCVSLLYMGIQCEESQKMGERVAYYQAAMEKLTEVTKNTKGLEQQERVNEALAFTHDVVGGKLKAAEKENEYVYHEKVPDKSSLVEVKGASLVKGIPFDVKDPDIYGKDIFHRLVPMQAHEASSLYSEEKAKLLRRVGAQVDEKDEELVMFLTSLQVDQLKLHTDPETLPQELVDCCAALSAQPEAVKSLVDSMSKLSSLYHEVEAALGETQQLLDEENEKEKAFQTIVGKRPPSMILKELTLESSRLREAHAKAAESNAILHKAMTTHLTNLKTLSLPLVDIKAQLPSVQALDNPKDMASVKELQRLLDKVEEMRNQRSMLYGQLREAVTADDITKQLATENSNLEALFAKELSKHQRHVTLLEQNLSAQDKILNALTEANARYADTRRVTTEIARQRSATVAGLIGSFEAYQELLLKCEKGLEFYGKLEANVNKLLRRLRSVCKVQDEEREQHQGSKVVPKQVDTPAPVNEGPKLKDYLHLMRRDQSGTRPTPLGAERSDTALATQMTDTFYPYAGPHEKQQQYHPSEKNLTNQPEASLPTQGYGTYYHQGINNMGSNYGPVDPSLYAAPVVANYGNGTSHTSHATSVSLPYYQYPATTPASLPSGVGTQSTNTASVSFTDTQHPPASLDTRTEYGYSQPGSTYPTQYSYTARYGIAQQYGSVATTVTGSTPGVATTLYSPTYPYGTYQEMSQYHAPVVSSTGSSLPASYSGSSYYPGFYTSSVPPATYTTPASTTTTTVYSNGPDAAFHQTYTTATAVSVSYTPYSSGGTGYQLGYGYPTTGTATTPSSTSQVPAYGVDVTGGQNVNTSASIPYTPYSSSTVGYQQEYQYPAASSSSTASEVASYGPATYSGYQTYPGYATTTGSDPYPAYYNSSQGSFGYHQYASYTQASASSQQAASTFATATSTYPYYSAANTSTAAATQPVATTHEKPASNVDLLSLLDVSIPTVGSSILEPLVPRSAVSATASAPTGTATSHGSTDTKTTAVNAAVASEPIVTATPVETQPALLPSREQHVPVVKDPLADSESATRFAVEVEKLEKVVEGLNRKSLNGPTPLDVKWKEVLELQDKETTKRSISVARCYPMKNRYPDVLPYDHNRVELPTTKDDYINASQIAALSQHGPSFIATQLPLPCTQPDFWTMIWIQQVEVVACLLSDAEMKGAVYWPAEKGRDLNVGSWVISLQSVHQKQHGIERILTLTQGSTKASRVLVHLQLTCWPGSSLPASPAGVLSYTSELLHLWRQQRSLQHPVVIHCLAGAGRTGLICLLSAALADIWGGQAFLDIVRVAGSLCQQRRNMFRDREHLLFAYQAVLYYAQDLLLKRGILSSRKSFDERPASSQGSPARMKQHSRHPSQDFIEGPATAYVASAPSEAGMLSRSDSSLSVQSVDSVSSRGSVKTTGGALSVLDPANFSLDLTQTKTSTSKNKITKESFMAKSNNITLSVKSDPDDPLSQLDPLWSLGKK